jgi:ribonucleoside-triphosphate reductase
MDIDLLYKEICERCGVQIKEEKQKEKEKGGYIPFERIRRITGYLVGTVDRWNDGKRAELKDREKHG